MTNFSPEDSRELPDELADVADSADSVEWRELIVPVEAHGMRLDRVLADELPEFSRSYLQQLIGAGLVLSLIHI